MILKKVSRRGPCPILSAISRVQFTMDISSRNPSCVEYQPIIVYVDGYKASGKSALLDILRAHPEFFCDTVHIEIAGKLLLSPEFSFSETEGLGKFRAELAKTGYYRLEYFSQLGKYTGSLQTSKKSESRPFELDFYEFEKRWSSELGELLKFRGAKATSVIYYYLQLGLNSPIRPYVASLGSGDWRIAERLGTEVENICMVQVCRPVEDIMAALHMRNPKRLRGLKWWFATGRQAFGVGRLNRCYSRLARKNKNIFVIELSDALKAPEGFLDQVMQVLKGCQENDECVGKLGETVFRRSLSATGEKVNDTAEGVFTGKEITYLCITERVGRFVQAIADFKIWFTNFKYSALSRT